MNRAGRLRLYLFAQCRCRLLNFTAAGSVVLCFVLVVLGIRSFWKVASLVIVVRGEVRYWVDVERCQLTVWKQRRAVPHTPPERLLEIQPGDKTANQRPRDVITASALGFGAETVSQTDFDAAVAQVAMGRLSVETRRQQIDRIRDRAEVKDESVAKAQARANRVSSADELRVAEKLLRQTEAMLNVLRSRWGFFTQWQVAAPMWAPVATTLILPMVWVTRWRRQRARAMIGMCAVCGYDLRATPDRCPECGAIPAAAKGAAA